MGNSRKILEESKDARDSSPYITGIRMSGECQSSNPTCRKNYRPSERAALVILGILRWFKDIFSSPFASIPRGQVIQHQGGRLSAGQKVHYQFILLVEDNPDKAREFVEALKNYYLFGSVTIFVAHAYDAAQTFFANEDINLVIMDADLDDDDGDGTVLTRTFVEKKPGIIILANSSNRISNLKLTGFGARETLGKKPEKLKSWLFMNDPAGSKG